ncbi:MAG: hypothetical protein EHM35_02475 [Planctomycetaceae bacterium]|nr:MAG: hypothetical protein EHM35_02475 [Planctomycetaceae bacterium]
MTRRAKATLILAAVFVATVLVMSMAGCLLFRSGDTDQEPGWSEVDWPDCDADNRSPHWESADCGKSPAPHGKTIIKLTPSGKQVTKTPGRAGPASTRSTRR